MHQPRVLVISSCTGEKRSKPENQLTLEDFKDSAQLQKGEAKLVKFACPAGQIYTGQQQLRTRRSLLCMRGNKKCFGQTAFGYKTSPKHRERVIK